MRYGRCFGLRNANSSVLSCTLYPPSPTAVLTRMPCSTGRMGQTDKHFAWRVIRPSFRAALSCFHIRVLSGRRSFREIPSLRFLPFSS